MANNEAKKLYELVIDEVCLKVRDALTEEGYDQHTLDELKTLWLARLRNSKALESAPTSIIDDSTRRNYRHHQSTMHSAGTASTSATRPLQHMPRPTQMHEASATALTRLSSNNPTSLKPSQMTTLANGSGAPMSTINLVPANSNQGFPSNITMNRASGSGLIGAIAKSSTQLDGTNDPTNEIPMNNKANQIGKIKKRDRILEISLQLDGTGPPMTDDEDEDADNEEETNEPGDDLDEDDDDEANGEGKEDGKPLCSEDDVSEDDPTELFDADNVVVCQYDKISRTKNKWRFHLKSGIMNLQGRDYIFNRAVGDADW